MSMPMPTPAAAATAMPMPMPTMNMTDGHMMSPYLFSRTTNFYVLFEGAYLRSTAGFVAALLLSALFGLVATVLSQLFKVYETRALLGGRAAPKLSGSVLFALRLALHYIAMLIVMTMNVWLIIAVVVGHGLGWGLYALALHRFVGKDASPAMAAAKDGGACDC